MAVRIFASSFNGANLERWGAVGFTDRGTRDKLAATIGPDDYVLSIGTTTAPTALGERGRLLALMKIGATIIQTSEMVEPSYWAEHIAENGRERWPHGFPVRSAERFDDQPLPARTAVLPRIDRDNLYAPLARHFIELTPDEVERVLSLPRSPEPNIYASPVSAFAARLLKHRPGPPPVIGVRTLTPKSGAAATYLMKLGGSLCREISRPLRRPAAEVFKIGFSNDPIRRRDELNAYLPCEETLCWNLVREQWHEDEINAWALEQALLGLIDGEVAHRFKGEMVIADERRLDALWDQALASARRPTSPVEVQS